MRAFAAALIALAFAPVAACGAAPAQFDLVCHGQMTSNGASTSFETRLHIDLASNRFCLDSCLDVFHLTQASSAQLAYHYDIAVADADHAANRYRGQMASSAGPYPQKEDITVDRRTGAYRRTYLYSAGDPAARTFNDSYVGQCQVMPYTGLAARAG
jgi:hypothetical protein